MEETGKLIGRVTRCSTRGFVAAVRLPEPDLPVFGSFCKAEAQHGNTQVIGLIYDISIQDDEFARQVAAADRLTAEQLADSQVNRQVPVEFSALAIGYQQNDQFFQVLPPQPPLTLAPVRAMTSDEIRSFTERLDFMRIVLNTAQIPADDLLPAAVKLAALSRPESERKPFLVGAGGACAGLLTSDLTRLDNVIRQLGW